MQIDKINARLYEKYGGKVQAEHKEGCIILSGKLEKWAEVVDACSMCVVSDGHTHVVNDIDCPEAENKPMRLPLENDKSLDGRRPDVLIIGGGISGASIARELSRWDIDILLVEKESDLAMQASGRNDGEVHPGVDLIKGSLKQHYVLLGNRMYGKICKELDVPFERCGQIVGFPQKELYPLVKLFALYQRKISGVKDTRVIKRKQIEMVEPGLNENFSFALSNPSAGCVCPYSLTIAYAENAVMNGAHVSLNTAVLSMDVKDGKINRVSTNRGEIFPAVVINAAGVFSEEIAKMAGDRFFSIHPRRGTNSILDKKSAGLIKSITSIKKLTADKSHTKGGGILHTVHGNLLVGPDAVETNEKENFATHADSIKRVFDKQKNTAPELSERNIITFFTGVRAPTFEEDFIIEKGRKTENIIHCAGIQSPGLTTAPAVAVDVQKMVIEQLKKNRQVLRNTRFNPNRRGVPVLREMSPEDRDAMIKKNPDYGVIVCRCEEISRGEIIDALNAPICVPTLDGIKKRVRPGMGRCQGGFCSPNVMQIIAEHMGIPLNEVKKASGNSVIVYGGTKEESTNA